MPAIICPKQSAPVSNPNPGMDPVESEKQRRTIFAEVWFLFFNAVSRKVNANSEDIVALQEGTAGLIQYGDSADRIALDVATLTDGAVFVEQDRGQIVYQLREGVWAYVSGAYDRLQSELAALAGDLTTDDTGFLVNVTDFAHILRWDGAAWEWGPGDPRNAGHIAFFDADPGDGWKIIDGLGDDGSAIGALHPIAILQSDGTKRSNTTAAAINNGTYVRAAAAYDGTVTPATNPTVLVAITGAPAVQVGAGAANAAAVGHGHNTTVSLADDPIAYTEALPYIRR